ncbi:DUF933 domain-containing protein [Candidatus Fermentibacteria bacterium]|nr:DUF933 domain-containing protein [Candidatus Fermentibacteria bacterium]
MKIAYTGLSLPEGKRKYNDETFADLVDKFRPAKVSPFYFELRPDAYTSSDVIAILHEQLLDLLILDMEKIEGRLSRTEDEAERAVLSRCMAQLEDLKPICDLPLDEDERAIVKALGPLSFTPTVVSSDRAPDADELCHEALDKAGMMFFYTVGKQEVHAWLVRKGADAVTCADRIHSDLARGFIKAELVSCADMMTAHNMQDARSKGLAKLVDRDYIVPENSILDIRFNV